MGSRVMWVMVVVAALMTATVFCGPDFDKRRELKGREGRGRSVVERVKVCEERLGHNEGRN